MSGGSTTQGVSTEPQRNRVIIAVAVLVVLLGMVVVADVLRRHPIKSPSPSLQGLTLGMDNAEAVLAEVKRRGMVGNLAYDGSLWVGTKDGERCEPIFDFPEQPHPACEKVRLNFVYPITGEYARASPPLRSIQYEQRFGTPIHYRLILKELEDTYGALTEVNHHVNKVQSNENYRYVRILAGDLKPAELDILKENEVAQQGLADGCKQPIKAVRVKETRRIDMVLSYEVELIDVQLLCLRLKAVEEFRMEKSKTNLPQMRLN